MIKIITKLRLLFALRPCKSNGAIIKLNECDERKLETAHETLSDLGFILTDIKRNTEFWCHPTRYDRLLKAHNVDPLNPNVEFYYDNEPMYSIVPLDCQRCIDCKLNDVCPTCHEGRFNHAGLYGRV